MDEELIGMEELIGLDDDLDDIIGEELIGADDDVDDFLSIMGYDDDDDDEIGDDDYDEIGRRRRRGRRRRGGSRRRRALAKALKRKKAKRALAARKRGGAIIAPQRPANGRVLIFGDEQTQGAAAGALTLSSTVQELCRPMRIVIGGRTDAGVAIANQTFSVSDIKVGVLSQLTSNNPVSGLAFTADNTSMVEGFQMDTIQTGTEFSVQLTSVAADSIWNMAVFARAMR